MAKSRYINSINALGVSLSFTPIQIQIEHDISATAHPNHCTAGLPPLKVNALTMAKIKPVHLHLSILL